MSGCRFSLGPVANPHYQEVVARPLFDADQCRAIVELAEAGTWQPAGLASSEARTVGYDAKIRSAGLCILPEDESWPFAELVAALGDVNSEVYRFDLTGIFRSDGPSVARYRASETDHFRPHQDAGRSNARRKLTYVVQLSDPSSYAGGDLLISDGSKLAPRQQGTLVVFPSTLVHVVAPVTAGVRHVIVGWVLGPTLV